MIRFPLVLLLYTMFSLKMKKNYYKKKEIIIISIYIIYLF